MITDPEAVAVGRRSDPTVDPRAFASLFGALARGCLEFVTESIRVGGNVVGDLGDLVADGADRAAGGLNERVDRRFDSLAPTTRVTRRTTTPTRVAVADVVNRTIDGCVDVIESSARTFEDVYNQQRRSDRSARSSSRPDDASDAPIKGYDALTVEQVLTRLESIDTADEAREVLAYEQLHKDRKTVIAAAQARLTTLTSSTSTSSAGDG